MSEIESPGPSDTYPSGYPKVFWPAFALGWVLIAVGVRGILVNQDSPMATDPIKWVLLLVKSNLVHDFVLVPVVLAVGVVVARFAPPKLRAPLQSGLIASGIVALYAFPFVRGYGRKPSNPTILPLDYGQGLLMVLGVIWLVVAAWSVRRFVGKAHE